MKNYKSFCLYLFCLLLCLWYMTVLYWSRHPRVSAEYSLYYLDKKLVDWPGNGGLKYQPGDTLYFGSENNNMIKVKHRGLGWEIKKEDWGSRTSGNSAHLYLTFMDEPEEDFKMIINAASYCPDSILKVDVVVNGLKVDTLSVEPSKYKDYSVMLPRHIITRNTPIHFEFVMHSADTAFDNNDDSSWGMGVRWLKIENRKSAE